MSEEKTENAPFTWENLPIIAKTGLKIVAGKQNFMSYIVDIESGSKVGDGYMSIILRATIKGTKHEDGIENKNDQHELPVLCKMQVLSTIRRELCNSDRVFEREVNMYNEFLPAIKKLQLEYGIEVEDGFFNYPKCYHAVHEKETGEAILILKDMRDEGYTLGNKYKPLDIDTCRLVVQGLGRLHAMTFALKKHKPELFEQFKNYEDTLCEIMLKPEVDSMWDTVFNTAQKSLPDSQTALKKKLENLRKNIDTELKYVCNSDTSSEYSVVTHGDSWTNNFLFKSSHGKHNEIVFIDWQISRYSSPVLDLVYFIFCCTDKDTRDEYYTSLIQFYHESLYKLLQKFGENGNNYFPYTKLEEHLKMFGRFGLLMSLCLVPFTTIPPEELPDMDKAMEEMVSNNNGDIAMLKAAEKNSERVESRIRDIVLDMENYGYLP